MASGTSLIKRMKGAIAPTNLRTVAVTVNAAANSGTATVKAGAKILGILPAGNQDQFVDNVALSGTTLTVTLAAAATANNTFNVTVLEV
ncbi:hypothetical protein QFZ70_001512 [Arthrobacter sp. V1I9]|uniref:hypothetical protein n=1 Tax=Arthrobacter sp. V1I9 TaxID=3042275 RepID=UPI00278DB0B8|nr:hypothetical protein [Arthrobacter sp. V1I9]MDQ0869039.1 hypothetical protein [Arthrobacter sp. V1I9]